MLAEARGSPGHDPTLKAAAPAPRAASRASVFYAGMTQYECMMACEVEPSCVSITPLPALTIHTHARTNTHTHATQMASALRPDDPSFYPASRRSATTTAHGAEYSGRAQSCGT